MKLEEYEVFYAVKVDGKKPFFAKGSGEVRALFKKRKEAQVFCGELREYLALEGKVVKVLVAIAEQ